MWRQFRPLYRGELIVAGGDCGEGVNDYSVCQFMSVQSRDVPIVWSAKVIATEMTGEVVTGLEMIYDITLVQPIIAYEMQHGGVFEMDRIHRMNKERKYIVYKMPVMGKENPAEPIRYGWDTNSVTRPAMLTSLKEDFEHQIIRVYDDITLDELMSFVLVQNVKSRWRAEAESGAHDDHIMSLAIANKLRTMYGTMKSVMKKAKKRIVKKVARDIGMLPPEAASWERRQYLRSQKQHSSRRRAY